ncbi:hypothetical protein [Intrasporangium sp. DVR]|uniref:hypothetical protein n=1 Tax=Intrasporangium sp. DVR TaxID=3127867 RepID=UPI0033415272
MRTPAPARPLSAVLGAIRSGSGSVAAVEHATGLPRDVVEAAVDHLARVGRLTSESLSFGCPASGCGGCLLAARGDRPCAVSGPSEQKRGVVLMSLRTP